VKLAARGLRDMDNGSEPITDPAELRQVLRQARAVHIETRLAAAAITVVVVLIS
jgi:hypothetical protein